MDKGLIVLKWVLIVWPKIPKRPQNLPNLSDKAQKVLDFNEKMLHWASLVRGGNWMNVINLRQHDFWDSLGGLRAPINHFLTQSRFVLKSTCYIFIWKKKMLVKLYELQSNLVIRNLMVTLKLFLNAKCSLS